MAMQGSNTVSAPAALPTLAWVKLGLLFAAFAGLFHVWLYRQALHSSSAMADWGHVFVVPLISGYIVWQNRREVLATGTSTFWPGLAPLLLGVFCYFFFIVGVPNHMFMGFSAILTLAGLSLFLLGPRVFHYLFLPIAYLVFAVTISEQVIIKLTFALKQVAAVGAYVLLQLVSALTGHTFIVDLMGTQLTVGSHTVDVAEACSGMRMVIAFFALAGAVALLMTRIWWQRVALLLLALPVAVFTNILRVAVLGLLGMWKPGLATGDAHMLIGTLVLVVGLGIFMGIQWALDKIVVTGAPPVPARSAK
jgi:exosortase